MFDFEYVKPHELCGNVFDEIGNRWLIIGCRDDEKDNLNLMTASWGTMGVLWGKPICTLFVRPGRYTRELADKTDTLTVSVFDEKYRDQLKLCGTKSGRDVEKAKICGFTTFEKDGFVGVNEADRVYLLKKLYTDMLRPENLLDQSVEKWYPIKDYHKIYICEIVGVLDKKAGNKSNEETVPNV